MLILPIKKKWFDMILRKEKLEEYREIKPYYHKRLGNYFINHVIDSNTKKVLRKMSTTAKEVIFRKSKEVKKMKNKEIEKALYWLENECEPIYDDHEESVEELLQKQLNNYNSIKQYINLLENKVKELGKGQHKLMQSRRKWKNRYYKERQKNRKYLKNL